MVNGAAPFREVPRDQKFFSSGITSSSRVNKEKEREKKTD
jgi:hypothetical protein